MASQLHHDKNALSTCPPRKKRHLNSTSTSISPAVWTTGAATGFSIARNLLQSRKLELYSEIVCWAALPLLFFGATILAEPRRSSTKLGECGGRSRVTFGRCFSFTDSTLSFWIVAPILHPLFLAAQKYVNFEPSDLEAANAVLRSSSVSIFRKSLAAGFLCVITVWSSRLHEVLLSSIFVIALLGIMLALAPSPSAPARSSYPRVKLPQDAGSLATHINTVFGVAVFVQGIFFGFPSVGLLSVMILGIIKLATWYFTIKAILRILPPSLKGRSTLWLLFIFALTPHFITQYSKFAARSLATDNYQELHPIQLLMQEANLSFQAMMQNQSQNYTAACKEYKRRYKVDPPAGFESWYNYAKIHHSPIIDDFDTLYHGIAPFWAMSGKEYVGAMEQAIQLPISELWSCDFSGTNGTTYCHHPYRTFDRHFATFFDTIAEDVRQELSNVSFLVNHLDEPRVIPPHGRLSRPSPLHRGPLRETDFKQKSTWDLLTRNCDWTLGRGRAQSQKALVPFVENTTASIDLCQHAEYRAMHGLFLSPTSFQAVEGSVPILSTGAVSTMGDILIPSPAYLEPGFRYNAATDRHWSQKSNNVYWAGSTTGGYGISGSTTWRHFHRQRFVSLVQNTDKTHRYSYLQEQDGVFTKFASSFLDSSLYDVSFTKIMQCDWQCCREQGEHFTLKSWADKDAALKSRLVLDMDGNGISGRYYKLLASQSAPMKQTLFREWHDDRLVPWVHYIPVSPGMEEMAELTFFFTSTQTGQQRARWIADQGRRWSSQALREVDMSIYLYRLLLELARLQDADRGALVNRGDGTESST
ncbi:hypothetical protein E4U55_006723 [Claviceps digitariae]|nr:hypothetical protein E4U55_006723 [Claviceps digitariae]